MLGDTDRGPAPAALRPWLDTFPVIDAGPDWLVIQVDPIEPRDCRRIERRVIEGGAELGVGHWVRLTPKVLANPANGLQP